MSNHPIPTEIRLHQRSRVLEVVFDDGARFTYPAEFLRVYSPSAAVRGHAPGQWVLQIGKERVGIDSLQPVGRYAVKIVFDDGHASGLFDWRYLYRLGTHQDALWSLYHQRLAHAAGRTTWPDPFAVLGGQDVPGER